VGEGFVVAAAAEEMFETWGNLAAQGGVGLFEFFGDRFQRGEVGFGIAVAPVVVGDGGGAAAQQGGERREILRHSSKISEHGARGKRRSRIVY